MWCFYERALTMPKLKAHNEIIQIYKYEKNEHLSKIYT